MGILVVLGILGLIIAILRGELNLWLKDSVKGMGILSLILLGIMFVIFLLVLFKAYLWYILGFMLISFALSSIISGAVEEGVKNSQK